MSDHKHATHFWLPDGVIHHGSYTPGQRYHIDDIVEHGNQPLICIKDIDAQENPDPTYWKPFVPQDYIVERWTPMHYVEGSYVFHEGAVFHCLKMTTSDPTDTESWVVTDFIYEGYWVQRVYNPGDIVKFKNKYYECVNVSTAEKPSDYTHWRLVEKPDTSYIREWKIQHYKMGDIVFHDGKLYVCNETATIEPPSSDLWKQLPESAKWCGKWKHKAYSTNTIVNCDGLLYVALQEATDQPLTDTGYWYRLNIQWRGNWKFQNYHAGDYVIYDSRPFLCIRDTQRSHPLESQFWYQFCEGGVQFPSWFPDPRSIEINIPFGQELKYHSSSGGYYWDISPPKLLGTKTVPFEDVPKEIRSVLPPGATATEVYMLSEWHVGEFENNGRTEHFYGAVFDGYYEGADKLIAMLNPVNKTSGFRQYFQWRYEVPFIAQPNEFDWLVLLNRAPHPKITEFFKIASQHIQISNRMRINESAFEDEMREVISQEGYQESESRRQIQASNKGDQFKPMSYEDYREQKMTEWVQSKYEIKMTHMKLGHTLHKRAEEQVALWQEQWIKRMKTQTHEISSRINEIVREFVGYDKWFTMSAVECKKMYPQINWDLHNKRIRLVDIEEKRVELEQQWEEYDTTTGAWKMIKLSGIERIINSIKAMFPDEQKAKRHTRRKKTSKGKNV